MKKNLATILLLAAWLSSWAQTPDYYWYKNEKVYLEKVSDKKFILVDDIKDANDLKQKLNLPNVKVDRMDNTNVNATINGYASTKAEKKWAVVQGQEAANTKLASKARVLYEGSFYKAQGKDAAGLSHLFYVKLRTESDLAKLEQLANKNKVEIMGNNKFMPLWYTLSCTKASSGNALEMANLFYEAGHFAAAEPDWMSNFSPRCGNDTHFNDQWGLNNTGQNGGTAGTDIKACNAWSTTMGSNNIIVAVLDHGVELNHPDLTNMHPVSFDTETGTSPSIIRGEHGNACAGIIGAKANNNLGIAGITPNCPIMSLSNDLMLSTNSAQTLANGINFAWQNGASVISNSWGHNSLASTLIDNAITNALTLGRNGLGTVVVFSAGNTNSSVIYPGNSNSDIIVTGALSPCAQRKSTTSCDGESWWGSSYGSQLDIMAPGVLVPTTDLQGSDGYDASDYFLTFNGTSAAAPHVAAVAAMILSINHNLTQKQVADIIEQTAQKLGSYTYTTTSGRPNGTWHNEMGYGVLNAQAAVQMAQSMCTTTGFDLFAKDNYHDFGLQPNPGNSFTYNPTNPYMWLSNDIWIRNQPDGITNQTHENPEASPTNDPNQLNFVYVRVRNRGCQASPGTGNETLQLSWAKAATSLSWPNNWDGSTYLDPPNNQALAGNLIGTQTIPSIPPGGEAILTFTWNPNDPALYNSINTEPWHFCLLGRIVSSNDPIAYTETGDVNGNVKNNNNIIWKNVTVVTNIAGIAGGGSGQCAKEIMQDIGVAVAVGNPDDSPEAFDVEFSVPSEELTNPVTREGQVMVALSEPLYDRWVKGGKKGTGFKEVLSPPMSDQGIAHSGINSNSPVVVSNRKMFEITGSTANFANITLEGREVQTTSMMILYPSNPVSAKENFKYDIVQRRTTNKQVVGGVRYAVQKPSCLDRATNAGSDRSIDKGCSVTLNAAPMPCAAHWWVDESGNIAGRGASVTVSPTKTTTYKLVTVSAEGCMSEDQVTVFVSNRICRIVKEREIVRVSPNPADDRVVVEYKVKEANSAQLRLVKTDSSFERTYQVDVNTNEVTLDVSERPAGSYTLTLICDGIVEDSRTIVIQ